LSLRPTRKLSNVFSREDLPEDTIHIIVRRPQATSKRPLEEDDAARDSKRIRPGTSTLRDAIKSAGLLTKEPMKNGSYALSPLTQEERLKVLEYMGQDQSGDSHYASLWNTARILRERFLKLTPNLLSSSFQQLQLISASSGEFPVTKTEHLYVREAYKELYQEIIQSLWGDQSMIITGTSGIGKSTFLIYFTIRLLTTWEDGKPPIVIFHKQDSSQCCVFGGLSIRRYGPIKEFQPFLELSDTWYLVDSSRKPIFVNARTIIAASPKTLYSNTLYKEVEKQVDRRYYMAPWTLNELKECRNCVQMYSNITEDLLEELYSEIGGVPRYVLEKPMKVLKGDKTDIERARTAGLKRVKMALTTVTDPVKLMQCFSEEANSFDFSNRLIHSWPSLDHESFTLAWASMKIADEVSKKLKENNTRRQILEKIISQPDRKQSWHHV
ncbi:hypothetical protein BGZ65_004977, partial [Modicella reniformis]